MRRRAAQIIAIIIVVGCVLRWAGFDPRAAGSVRADPIDRWATAFGFDQRAEAAVRQPPDTWKTFTSAEWGVALDYPPSWTVDADGEEVAFRSPDGAPIVLGRTATDARSEPAPGRRTQKPECTTTTTSHDVAATVCVDAASLARRAVLVLKSRDGRPFRLALRTRGHDAQIFDAMVASVRRHP